EKVVQRTISRCLAPVAADRYSSAAELAEQFDGCRRLRRVELQLPAPPRILAGALRRPFLWLFLLTQVPQFVASGVNFTYNFSQFGRDAIYDDRALVTKLAIIYNLIVYPVSIGLLIRAVLPVWRCWRKLKGKGPISDEEVTNARKQALRLPVWFTGI